MDAHDRFERRSLRDVLVAQGVLAEEVADELMTSARETNEPFGAVVLDAGHLTAWDLAKTVAAHYNLPCIPLTGFTFDKSLFGKTSYKAGITVVQRSVGGILNYADSVACGFGDGCGIRCSGGDGC